MKFPTFFKKIKPIFLLFLCIPGFVWGQTRTVKDNSPAIVAEKLHITYGLDPRIIRELIDVFDKKGMIEEQRNLEVEKLIETYSNLSPSSNELSNAEKQSMGILNDSRLTKILNWDLFLKKQVVSTGKNSPAVYAPNGYVEIWYGIPPSAFNGIYQTFKNWQSQMDDLDADFKTSEQQLAEQIKRFKELEEDLAKRVSFDRVARKAKKLLDIGDIDGAEKILEGDVLENNRESAIRNFELAKVKELNLKLKEARKYFELATQLDSANPQYQLYAGQILNKLDKKNEALNYLKKAVAKYQNQDEKDSVNIALCLNKIANTQIDMGEYQSGLAYNRQALEFIPINEREKLGYIYSSLGVANYHLGNYDSAFHYYFKALELGKEIFGKVHPSIVSRLNNIGSLYSELGKFDLAIDYYDRALEIGTKIYGLEHPKLAYILNNLGDVRNHMGQYEKAIEYYLQALELDQKIYGEFHSLVGADYNNLGSAYDHLGNAEKAIEFFQKGIYIFQKVFGDSHPNTAVGYSNLANVLINKGEIDSGIEYLQKAIEILESGEKKTYLSSVYNGIGLAYKVKGNYQSCIEYHTKALNLDLEIFGISHPNLATTYNNLGSAYSNIREFDKSNEFYQKALIINQETFGPEHISVATNYNNIGENFRLTQKYNEAIDTYLKSIPIYIKNLGEEHFYIAGSYNNLGAAYKGIQNYDNSIDYISKALSIYKKLYKNGHPGEANCYNNIGEAYLGKKDYDLAIESFQNSLLILVKMVGEIHPYTYILQRNIGTASFKKEDYMNAKQSYLKALDISQKLNKAPSQELMTLNQRIGISFYHLENPDSALIFLNKVFPLADSLNLEKELMVQRTLIFKAKSLYQLKRKKEAREIRGALKKKAREENNDALLTEIKQTLF